jgi:uncharacterized membrane protein YbhN (UPF0104 family)
VDPLGTRPSLERPRASYDLGVAANAPRRYRAEPLPEGSGPVEIPKEFDTRRLVRRALIVVAILAVVGLIVGLAPGLGEIRTLLQDADPAWIAVAVGLEALSCLSYVAMFRPVFCRHMSFRTSWDIAWSELAMGSIVPASGAGGLALGAWILHEGGMSGQRIARRSVAFFLIKSSVNFVAVAVLGLLLFSGVVGPNLSPLLTLLPAVAAIAVIVAVVWIGRLGPGDGASPDAGRLPRWWATAREALVGGTAEALQILRTGDPLVIGGAIGYWLFDNLVLLATYHAFGAAPAVSVVLMGYLIGQLGGALPIPGGLGGIDGGLLGTLIVYGAGAAHTAAAVLAYRVILFWLPLVVGSVAFLSLRRALNRPDRPDLCVVPAAG